MQKTHELYMQQSTWKEKHAFGVATSRFRRRDANLLLDGSWGVGRAYRSVRF